MDAAARDELSVLRRRAFGPDADIHDDPAALARLIELEELARPPAPEEPVELAPTVAPDAEPKVAVADPVVEADAPAQPRWRRTIIAATAVAALVISALVLAQPLAVPLQRSPATMSAYVNPFLLTAEPRSKTLLTIRTDASFGGYIRMPTEQPTPSFPTSTTLDWAAYLGEYYGWELWIAGGGIEATDSHCIVVRRDDDTRGRCGDAASRSESELRVSIAASDIPVDELPEPMEARDRIRFRWPDNGSVELVLGMFGSD